MISKKNLFETFLKVLIYGAIVFFIFYLFVPISIERKIAWALIVSVATHVSLCYLPFSKSKTIGAALARAALLAAITLFLIFVFALFIGPDLSPEGQKFSQGLSFLVFTFLSLQRFGL